MLVPFSRSVGALATLCLLLPVLAGPLGAVAQTSELLQPTPLLSSTLPGPFGVGDTLFFDDFDWCDDYPCGLLEAPPMSERLNHANGGLSAHSDAWLVEDRGSENTGALAYATSKPGRSLELRIQPDKPFASPGRAVAVTFEATGPAYATLTDGGLRLEVKSTHLGVDTGWMDCWVIPAVATSDGHWEFASLNPACTAIPFTSELRVRFSVAEAPTAGVPDNVAIDSIQIIRVA